MVSLSEALVGLTAPGHSLGMSEAPKDAICQALTRDLTTSEASRLVVFV